MESKEITKEQIMRFVNAAHEIGMRKLTRCSSGNLSWRIGNVVLVSATGSWLPSLKEEQVAVCKVEDGTVLNGVKPSMESGFHLRILRKRPEINVVLHCQSLYATAIACMKKKPDNYNVTIEIPCYCGKEIGIVPYFRPGSEELAEAVAKVMQNHDVAIMEKHGEVYAGGTLEETIQKAEFFEMACEILLHNGQNCQFLSPSEMEDLERYVAGKSAVAK